MSETFSQTFEEIVNDINKSPVVQDGDITIADLQEQTKRDRYFLTRYMDKHPGFTKIERAYNPKTHKNITVYRPK